MPHTDSQNLQSGEVKFLPSDSELILQIHYGPYGETQQDSSCVHINFTEAKSYVQLQNVPIIQTSFLKDTFLLPAEQKKRYSSSFYLPEETILKSITPLSHLLATSWQVIAVTPGGNTTLLLSIEDWDFHWKEKYIFKKPKELPAGTRIICTVKYDNRSENLFNPSSPAHSMKKGPNMFDENMLCYFEFAIETTQTHLQKPFTNSKKQPPFLTLNISESGQYKILLYNLNSTIPQHVIERHFHKGQHKIQTDILPTKKGAYQISIKQENDLIDSWYFSLQ